MERLTALEFGVEELRDACSRARIELHGDMILGIKTHKQTNDLADKAMIEALKLEESLKEE